MLRQENGKIVETKKIRRYKDEEQHDEAIDLEILTGLVGQEVSYKNLCELLNWKYDTHGNTKKAQWSFSLLGSIGYSFNSKMNWNILGLTEYNVV